MSTSPAISNLLPLLRCPTSGAELVLDAASLVSADPATRLRYAIVDDIPVLRPDAAETLELAAWSAIMQQHGRDATTGARL